MVYEIDLSSKKQFQSKGKNGHFQAHKLAIVVPFVGQTEEIPKGFDILFFVNSKRIGKSDPIQIAFSIEELRELQEKITRVLNFAK